MSDDLPQFGLIFRIRYARNLAIWLKTSHELFLDRWGQSIFCFVVSEGGGDGAEKSG